MKMKNLKRVFSTALASMMALSMLAIPVSAEEITGETTTTTTVGTKENPVKSIGVTKNVTVEEKGTLLPDMTFTITMEPATGDDLKTTTTKLENGEEKTETTAAVDGNNITIESAPALAENTLEFEFDASMNTKSGKATDTQDFNFTFANDFKFDHSGVYRYVVTETLPEGVTPNDEGIATNGFITYDTNKYYVDCYVDKNNAGEYVLYTYTLKKYGTDEKPQNITFTNAVDCASVEIHKEVEGTEYKDGQFYTFRLMIPVGGTTIVLQEGQYFLATINNEKGQVTGDDRLDEDGYVKIYVRGNIGDASLTTANSNEFKLKKDEYLKIIGAPVSMIYKVEEVVDEVTDDTISKSLIDQNYTTSYKYEEYGTLETVDNTNTCNKTITNTGSVVRGTTNTIKNEVTFINKRTVSVGTGINLDMVPYVLITLIAVCGSILFFTRKRRVDR